MVITCKKPCKKKRSTMLTVEQMADIALGTPEIGAVNFNVLHALIHVIIQQLNIQKCLVEFKGYDSDRMEGIILSAKPGPILKLSEYMIDVGDGKPYSGKDKDKPKVKEEREDNIEKKPTAKKGPCECSGKKKKPDEGKEKMDKEKEESDADNKKETEKTVIKRELEPEDYEKVDEPEPKKVREPKKKTCPCKEKKETAGVLADETLRAIPSSYYGSDTEPCQTIVRVEPVGEKCDSWRSRPALAHESMIKLEEKVAMLQDAFEALEQMPTNEELKNRACKDGTSTSTPVKDLWQMYNLHKRVEGCEGTIEKLASMIEDLVKETCNFREAMLVIADAVDEIECADETSRNCCAALQGRPGVPNAIPASGAAKSAKANFPNVSFVECEGKKPCNEKKEAEAQSNPAPKPMPSELAPSGATAPTPQTTPTASIAPTASLAKTPSSLPETEKPDAEQHSLEAKSTESEPAAESTEPLPARKIETTEEVAPPEVDAGPLPPPQPIGIGPEFYKMSASEKFCVLKENIDCLICQFKNFSENVPIGQLAGKLCALVSMQKQLDALEKEFRAFLEAIGPGGIGGLSSDTKNMKGDIENLNDLVSSLLADKQEMDSMIKNIFMEIENLKRVKADMEIVEDLLAGKADAAAVNRKVSHDQFDAACDDLTRGLDEALEKLMQQEAMWNEAMDEIQKDLESKLDKNEIMPLKEFINKKLKCLQEKLKQLAQLRRDAEAAGAKSRILRNLNCIACDNDVVMKMDNKSNYHSPAVGPSKSIKPMLTYELDQVRKAMKKGPCRAVNHVEEAVMDMQKKAAGLPLTTREAVDSKISKLAHFCNRYCGGSHTITTPQQRVTRIGHFLTEFGPQAMAMFSQETMVESKSTQQGSVMGPPDTVTPSLDFNKPC